MPTPDELKCKIHDDFQALLTFLAETAHPEGPKFQQFVGMIKLRILQNRFNSARMYMVGLINLSKEYDVIWDCMDTLEAIKQLHAMTVGVKNAG